MSDILRMSVTRDTLYKEVWAEPMIKVAARYTVSSNYLARVCHYLNVPFPHRGYWAKRQFGKTPTRPPLPDPRPGEVLEWEKGDAVRRPMPAVEPLGRDGLLRRTPSLAERPARHQLVIGVRESFEKARLSEVGYLRPFKQNLVDIFVTKETLAYALDTGNELFLRLEARGHRVALATDGHFSRPELHVFDGQKFDYYKREPWRPGRKTVAYVGAVAFGLTLYELTEYVDVTYHWDRPICHVRVSPAPVKRKAAWEIDRTTKQHMPCGRLGIRAYSPYGRVPWEKTWVESQLGGLPHTLNTIVQDIEAEAPALAKRRDEARKQAEIEHQQWLAECREREREEQEQRRAEALSDSRKQLLAITEEWNQARRIEFFFEDAARSAAALPMHDASALVARLDRARELLGGIDSLRHFAAWRSPEDRVTDGRDDDEEDEDDDE
jgi:uncharacterized membrane protein